MALRSCNMLGHLAQRRFYSVATKLKVAKLPSKMVAFIEQNVAICQPDNVHVCDGSNEEMEGFHQLLQNEGIIKRLSKYDNWCVWHALIY